MYQVIEKQTDQSGWPTETDEQLLERASKVGEIISTLPVDDGHSLSLCGQLVGVLVKKVEQQ